MKELEKPSLDKLRALDLPEGEYMVMGSGILEAIGIRKAGDIDLVASDSLYDGLIEEGWHQTTASNGSPRVEKDIFQVYNSWFDESEVKKLDDLLVDADWVEGVAFNSLAKLAFYKQRRGQDKDLADLELIRAYESKNNTQ